MTSTYDSSGITYDKYADIKADMETSAKADLGEAINLDRDSAYGHFQEIVALTEARANEIGQYVYDSGTIDNSSGVFLDGNVAHVGLERTGYSFSTISSVRLTAEKACVVPAGNQYSTLTNVVFETDEELVFTAAGTDTVACTCKTQGDIDVAIGELTVIKNAVDGITAVTNLTAAVPGTNRQTDAKLKASHTTATETSGEDDSAGIYEALYEIPISQKNALVVDNDSNVYYGSVPPHNIRVIVIGGTDEQVATAIWQNKTSGVPTFGTESYEVYDSTYGQTNTIYFDRGTEESVNIALNITKQASYPSDGDNTILEAYAAIFDDYGLGSNVVYNQCLGAAYSVPGVVLNSMTVDGGVVDVTHLDDERPVLDVVRDDDNRITSINVTITES